MQRMMLLYRSSVWKGRRRCCFQAVVIDGVRHGTYQGARLVIGSCGSCLSPMQSKLFVQQRPRRCLLYSGGAEST